MIKELSDLLVDARCSALKLTSDRMGSFSSALQANVIRTLQEFTISRSCAAASRVWRMWARWMWMLFCVAGPPPQPTGLKKNALGVEPPLLTRLEDRVTTNFVGQCYGWSSDCVRHEGPPLVPP